MKKMKKVMALLLSLVMVLAMSVVAFATESGNTYTITIENDSKTDHTYEAYQIFSGALTIDANGVKTLTDIQWGNGVTDTGKSKLGEDASTSTTKTAADIAKTLTHSSDAETFAKNVAKYLQNPIPSVKGTGSYTISSLSAGYYLVKDKDKTLTEVDDSYTAYIMEVVGNVTATPKSDKPSVEKKVQENTKTANTTGVYGERYNDTADYSIGDSVPFKLIGTVPDMSKYTAYKYTFKDTLSDAFDNVEVKDIKVYVSKDKAGTNKTDVTDKFAITSSANQITVSTDNLITVTGVEKGMYILVEYSAVLNDNARVEKTAPGNINKVYLEYSNNPNGEGIGKTPEDVVIVFTYKLDVHKIDGDTKANLAKVGFKLWRYAADGKTKEWAQVNESGKLTGWTDAEKSATELVSDAKGLFNVIGLDDGTYYIHESTTLPGYNSIDDAAVTISADTTNGQKGNGKVEELKTIEIKVNNKSVEGGVVTIENRKGSTLPTTGGMGTTIFYVVGSILVLGAAILLITKKRMSAR